MGSTDPTGAREGTPTVWICIGCKHNRGLHVFSQPGHNVTCNGEANGDKCQCVTYEGHWVK